MKPLIRLLKKQAISDDIRDSLVKMVKYTLQRDYILSHEAYMEMAVGNAPWPIGVTNAGIHARPGREKIFSKHVAHVLNDETQRKYIQGLKRLLTKAQQYFPTDPSRSIDYVRREDDSLPACTLSKPFRLAMEDIRIFFAVVLRIRKNRYCEVKSHPDSPLEQLLRRFANHTAERSTFLRISITLPLNTVTTH